MTSTRTIQTVDSILLSEYILQTGGGMAHLKLQKLLYYIQALHLAYFEHEIIDDDFEAWLHGPVSRKVYDRVKGLSVLYNEILFDPTEWNNGNTPDVLIEATLTSDQKELVDEVIENYGKFTPSQLETLSHSEAPWIDARKGYGVADKCSVIIPKEVMREYYKQQLYGSKTN